MFSVTSGKNSFWAYHPNIEDFFCHPRPQKKRTNDIVWLWQADDMGIWL